MEHVDSAFKGGGDEFSVKMQLPNDCFTGVGTGQPITTIRIRAFP